MEDQDLKDKNKMPSTYIEVDDDEEYYKRVYGLGEEEEDVEFSQEEFDKTMAALYENQVKLEDVDFTDFPPGIKKRIYGVSGVAAFFLFVVMFLIYKKITSISMYIFFILGFYIAIKRIKFIYVTAELQEYTVFKGIVVSVEQKRLLQTNKYKIIKISDGDRFLNIHYYGNRNIKRGDPISVYVDIESTILKTEEGLLIEDPLGVEFTVEEDDIDNDMKAGDIL